jgi:serine protease SohB
MNKYCTCFRLIRWQKHSPSSDSLHIGQGLRLTRSGGGYTVVCVEDRIIASPFATLGSIRVVAQLPNFHRLLKGTNVDFEVLTAGEHK